MRFICLCFSLVAFFNFASATLADDRPNIVLIMADDVSWECFGSYGADDYETPNIDALAADGVRFEHCYSTPICTPSRVKIMTGQYNFRNYTHFGYLNPENKTFGNLLRDAGYKTAVAGKWQLNGLYHKAENCLDNARPHQVGFDEYCLWQLTMTVNKRGEKMSERFWSPPLEQNGKVLSQEDNAGKYGPDIMSDFLCDFIERNRDSPFFVYYPSVLVHDPFVPTPDTIGDRPRTQKANLAPKSPAERKKNFVAMVNYMDKTVGKIVDKVREIGEIENTLILFTADNGTNRSITSSWKGREIQGGKATTTDMGTHVPLVAYWEGHTSNGVVSSDLVDFTDFYTTFADAAGVELGEDDPIDGRSFLPQLLGKAGPSREWQFNHYQPYWGKWPGQQYLRTARFKLYRDGRFFDVPRNLKEDRPIAAGSGSSRAEQARAKLQTVFDRVPPPPPKDGGPKAANRPTHPAWKNIVNPND